MIKERKYTLSVELLNSYRQKALRNAGLLAREARILLANMMWPGAYFLACAAIEECGKAFLAFNSVNRNLKDPSVQHFLKMEFENHSMKTGMGLFSLMRKDGFDKENLQYFLDLNFDLYAGREASLYTDIEEDNTTSLPEELVKPKAATDAVRLAELSLAATIEYVSTNLPQKFSTYDDKSFVVSKKKSFQKMITNPDFWWFQIEVMRSMPDSPGDHFSVAVARYWDEYFSKGKIWREAQSSPNNDKL